VGKTSRNVAFGRRLADRLRMPVGLICALVLVSGCGAATEEVVVTSTVTSTRTTTVTPSDWPDHDCLAPIVEHFEIDWERKFGPGIPPVPKPGESAGHAYFASYAPTKATVRLLNISPNNIYVRGVYFQVSWMDPDHVIRSNSYHESLPFDSIPYLDFGYLPKQVSGMGKKRSPQTLYGRDSIEFSVEYPGAGDVRVAGASEPHSWVESDDIDWWFADPDVRQRCGQS